MAEKVVIEFVPDFTQLTSAIDNLQQKGILKKEDADLLDKASKSMKDFATTTDKATTSVDKMDAAVQKDTNAVNELSNSVKEVPMKVLTQGTTEAAEALGNQGKKIIEVVTASKSLKGQLRELKAEMAALEDQGKDNTAEFEKMQIKAGKLNDQIGDTSMRVRVLGDDSKHIKAISQAITGAAAGFSVAQGAMALFGSENKEIEKALLKVNAAMAIANGLAQINEVIQKQSYLSIMAKTTATKALAATTTQETIAEGENVAVTEASTVSKYLQTAATSENIIVSNAATAAQYLLNAAMSANPIMLLVTALGALVGALFVFGNKQDDSKEKQEKLNKTHQEFLDLITKEVAATKQIASIQEQTKQNEIDLLRAKGKNAEADKLQLDLDKEKIKNAQNILAVTGLTIDQIRQKEITYKNDIIAQKEYLLQLEEFKKKGFTGSEENKAAQLAEQNKANLEAFSRNQRIQAYEKEYKDYGQFANAILDAEKKLELDKIELVKKTTETNTKEAEKRIADAKKVAEATNKTLLEIFDEDINLTEARLLNAKNGSQQELNLQIELAQAKAAKERELNQLSETSANAKAAKLVLINAKELDDIEKLNIAYNEKAIALSKKLLEAQKQATADFVKLSQDEYKASLQNLNNYYGDKNNKLKENLVSGNITEKEFKDESIKLEKDKNSKLETVANDYKTTVEQANTDLLNIEKETNDKSVKHFQMTEAQKEEIRKTALTSAVSAAKEIADAVFEIESNNRKTLLDEKLGDLEKRKELELANTTLTASQKASIESKYQKLEAKEKTKAWEADREAKREQAVINGALSIANIWATHGNNPPVAAILTALSLVAVGAQIAVINAQKVPKFAKGKNVGDMYEGPAIIGEAGRELRFDKDGSVKLYNSATLDHVYKDTIIAPNAITEALLSGTMPLANGAVKKYVSSQTSNVGFDYDKLAISITDNMRNHPKVAINIDEKGFEKRIIQGSNERTILNDRYKMNN